MTSTYAIECAGGLDQESSNLEVDPGRVRESLNYYALPMGGYERTAGYTRWSGSEFIPKDLSDSSVQIVEVDYLPDSMIERTQLSIYTSSLGVKFHVLGVREIFTDGLVSGYYMAASLLNERKQLVQADVVGAGPSAQAARVVDPNPALSDLDYSELVKSVFRSTQLAEQPDGDGTIQQIINIGDRVFALRASGFNSKLSWAVPNTATTGAWSFAHDVPMLGSDNWDHVVYKFAGRNEEAYFVNRVNQVYLFDSVAFASSQFIGPPVTGPVDAPRHLAVFKEHLFVATGETIQHSALGDPTDWTVGSGAGEINIGKPVTGLEVLPGNALAIFTEETIHILYGTSSADWRLEIYSREIGAIEGTIQNLPTTIFWDRRGIQRLEATDAFGDFSSNVLSHGFYKLFESMKGERLFSTVNRAKSQYRVFTSTGRGIYLTFNNKTLVGAMEIDLEIESEITCLGTKKNTSDSDDNFIGTRNGYVLRTDYGPSFDGNEIHSYIKFPHCHMGAPRRRKRWRTDVLDMTGDPRTALQARGEMDFGFSHFSDCRIVNAQVDAGRRVVNDPFTWDHETSLQAHVYLEGSSVAMGLVVKQDSASHFPHTIHHRLIGYTPRAVER